MAIVIAVLITLALVLKYNGEKAEVRTIRANTDKQIKDSWERYRAFEQKYSDRHFESECRDSIKKRDQQYKKFVNIVRHEVGIEPSEPIILLTMMADKCKIPWWYMYSCISNFCPTTKYTTYVEADQTMRNNCRFMKWYNKKLKTNGMDDDELYYEYMGNTVRVADMNEHRMGQFYWNSTKLHSGDGVSGASLSYLR